MRQYYTADRYIEYGSATGFKWKSDGIEVIAPAHTGWINSWGEHGNKVSTYNEYIKQLCVNVDL